MIPGIKTEFTRFPRSRQQVLRSVEDGLKVSAVVMAADGKDVSPLLRPHGRRRDGAAAAGPFRSPTTATFIRRQHHKICGCVSGGQSAMIHESENRTRSADSLSSAVSLSSSAPVLLAGVPKGALE